MGCTRWTDTASRGRPCEKDAIHRHHDERKSDEGHVGEREEAAKEGGKVVPPCIFGGTLLPPLARDVSTRTTIPTSKCTPNGRLHSCIKKKKKGKKKVVEEREKEGKKSGRCWTTY